MPLAVRFVKVIRSQRSQAGSGPAASYLFCFAKKGNPKKATTLPLAFGFPIVRVKKWESLETRFAQTARLSLSIFCLTQLAVSEVENVKSKSKSKSKTFTTARNFNVRRACMFSPLPHVATPIVLGKNGEEESQMFERSEFLTLPHF